MAMNFIARAVTALALCLGLGLIAVPAASAEIGTSSALTCQSDSWPGKTYWCPNSTPKSGIRKAEFPDGRVQVFVVVGTGQDVWTRMRRVDGTLTAWLNLGGFSRNYPSAGINSNGKAYVDVVGNDGVVRRNVKQSTDEWSGWTVRSGALGVFYDEVPTDNQIYGELVGRNMFVTDGPCKFYYKVLLEKDPTTGNSTVTIAGDFLSSGVKCDLLGGISYFNYDTQQFSSGSFGPFYGITDKDVWAQYSLGNIAAKTGKTLLSVDFSVSDYVGDVSQDAKTMLYDTRPCRPVGQGPYCGSYVA